MVARKKTASAAEDAPDYLPPELWPTKKPDAPTAVKKGGRVKLARAKASAGKTRKSAAALANALLDEDSYAAEIFGLFAETDAGCGMVTSAQAEEMLIGIRLPSLAMRLLLGSDVLTLGRNLMLVGLPGANKSAFLSDIYRWVLLHKGLAMHIETENKDSPDLRNSICNYDPKMIRRLGYKPANSQEEWMQALTEFLKLCEDKFAKVRAKKRGQKPKKGESAAEFRARTAAKSLDGKPGWVFPLIAGVDALTAVSSDITINKIVSEGAPERRYQIEAQYLSDYAKTLARQMRGKPMILASTNHLKPGQQDDGTPMDNIPGGKAMRFMNSTELKLVKLGKTQQRADYSRNDILLECIKNSLGETGLKVRVSFKWWWETDEETGNAIQRSAWDWETAAIEALLSQKTFSAGRWKAINDVVDLHVPESGTKTLWSKELGISKEKPVKLEEAGAILESRQDVLDALYPILHIKRRTPFTPGIDYTDILAQKRRAAEALAPVYSAPDLSAVSLLDDEINAGLSQAAAKKAAKAAKKAKLAVVEEEEDEEDEEAA